MNIETSKISQSLKTFNSHRPSHTSDHLLIMLSPIHPASAW